MESGRDFIVIEPESVAISSLLACFSSFEVGGRGDDVVMHAACDAYRAIQASLTAAITGSANIGASPPKVRSAWLRWFEDRPLSLNATPGWRVMSLAELLAEAASKPLPWSHLPLPLTAIESHFAGLLVRYRDAFAHPKQLTFVLTRREVEDAILFSVPIAFKGLREISHQLDEYEGTLAHLQVHYEKLLHNHRGHV